MSAFTVRSTWRGGLDGAGRLAAEGLEVEHAAPRVFGGRGTGTNPEELVLAAAASCYLITLGAILARRGIGIESIELTTEGVWESPPALRLVRVVHRPRVVLVDESQRETAREVMRIAEKACMIGQAMRGNVTYEVEA